MLTLGKLYKLWVVHIPSPEATKRALQMITAKSEWHQRHHPIICLKLASLDPSSQHEWDPKAPPNSCTWVSQPHSWQPIIVGYLHPLFCVLNSQAQGSMLILFYSFKLLTYKKFTILLLLCRILTLFCILVCNIVLCYMV